MIKKTKWKDNCVRCGYCCQRSPCSYSIYDPAKPYKCNFLVIDNEQLGIFKCSIHDDIVKSEHESRYPMFDNYCSSSFMNETREAVLGKMKDD